MSPLGEWAVGGALGEGVRRLEKQTKSAHQRTNVVVDVLAVLLEMYSSTALCVHSKREKLRLTQRNAAAA